MFAYCNNNPANGDDPTGHSMDWTRETYSFGTPGAGSCCGGGDIAVTFWILATIYALLTSSSDDCSTTVDGVSSASVPAFQQFAEQNVKEASIETKSVAGSTPATPPNNGNERDYRKIRSNARANEIAEKCGFENAEALKKWYVGRSNISKFNMYIDNVTNEVILIAIQGGTVVPTGCIIP